MKELVFVVQNKQGNWYFGYKIKVQRGIKGKTKSKVDELLIVGVPKSKFESYCQQEGIEIDYENMVY